MPRSVLLQLARDSITEVFEAQRTINKILLIQEHPLLEQMMTTQINIYIDNELRGSSFSLHVKQTLIEDIIQNAKRSAFEDKNFTPLTTSEYLSCEVEVILHTSDGEMKEKDTAILKNDNAKLQSITRDT